MVTSHSQKSKDVLIDSSSLFCVLKDKALRTNLLHWIKKGSRRLVLSPLLIEEALAHGNEELVIKQITEIGRIWRQLKPVHCTWVRMPYDIFTLESRQRIDRTPTATLVERKIFTTYLKDEASVTVFVRAPRKGNGLAQWKEKNLEMDLSVQNKAQERREEERPGYATDGLRKVVQSYAGPASDSAFLEPILKHVATLSGIKISATDVIKDPDRYHFIYTWICMAEVTGFGNALPEDEPSETGHRLRPDGGNWYDNSIAVSGSRCHLIFSEDKGFRWKVNHLHSKGLVQFEAKRINDVLAST